MLYRKWHADDADSLRENGFYSYFFRLSRITVFKVNDKPDRF